MAKKINVEKVLRGIFQRKIIYNEDLKRAEDNLEELLNECEESRYFYFGPPCFIQQYYEKNVNSPWHIKSIFDMGYMVIYDFVGYEADGNVVYIDEPKSHPNYKIFDYLYNQRWYLIEFSKNDVETIRLSFNNNDYFTFEYINIGCGFAILADADMIGKPCLKYGISYYYAYFKQIQTIIDKQRIVDQYPKTIHNYDYEFTEISSKIFYVDYLRFLYRYKKSVIDDFGNPDIDERLVFLKDYCVIIKNINYFPVQKNDIVIKNFYIDSKTRKVVKNIIIAENNHLDLNIKALIRPQTIPPHYILSFLRSQFIDDFCLSFFQARQNEDTEEFENVEIDITRLPLLLTKGINSPFYIKKYEFEQFKMPPVRQKLEKKQNSFYNTDAKSIILRDMEELKNNFINKSYKSAIIMAGSILEAFLIDWLSEINGKNYFAEDYMIFDRYRGKERRADLKDYIDAIEELKKPNWYDAAKKATEIRKKRNLVHAKLYIDNKDISKETCTEVIDYLEYVINTRW